MTNKEVLDYLQNIVQWQIQNFPDGGTNLKVGAATYIIWPKISPKTFMKMKKIASRGGRASLAPLRSVNTVALFTLCIRVA